MPKWADLRTGDVLAESPSLAAAAARRRFWLVVSSEPEAGARRLLFLNLTDGNLAEAREAPDARFSYLDVIKSPAHGGSRG